MSEFMRALPYVLDNEGANLPHGGKCNIPGDSGGRTNCGVSTPALADFNRRHPELRFPGDTWALTPDQIATFYRLAYWRYDGIAAQPVATKILDMGVNMGSGTAVELAQKVLGVTVDDAWGPASQAACNAQDSNALLARLAQVSSAHYRAIVAAKPADAKFLPDWLRRAARVPNA
jgi:lysozyme family protein